MIYNENGEVLNLPQRKSTISIAGETIDMSCFREALMEAAIDNPKFKKLIEDLKKDIDECDDENLKNQKDKGKFLSIKAKKLMTTISALVSFGGAGVGMIAGSAGSTTLTLACAALTAVGIGICMIVSSKPSKEEHLLSVAEEIVQFNDKLAKNKNTPESVRQKLDANSRRLANKIYKCRAAINNKPDFETYDYNMAADVRIDGKLVELDPMSNTEYEEKKDIIDNAIKIVNSNFNSILKDFATKIKKDYKDNENIKSLSISDITNAYGLWRSTILEAGVNKIRFYLAVMERDAMDKTLNNIPVVLGKVVTLTVNVQNNKIVNLDYVVTQQSAY